MSASTPRTLQGFLQKLEKEDKTLAQWAREKGFDLNQVYLVARGRSKGCFGESRRILKAMGVTPPPMFRARAAAKLGAKAAAGAV